MRARRRLAPSPPVGAIPRSTCPATNEARCLAPGELLRRHRCPYHCRAPRPAPLSEANEHAAVREHRGSGVRTSESAFRASRRLAPPFPGAAEAGPRREGGSRCLAQAPRPCALSRASETVSTVKPPGDEPPLKLLPSVRPFPEGEARVDGGAGARDPLSCRGAVADRRRRRRQSEGSHLSHCFLRATDQRPEQVSRPRRTSARPGRRSWA